MVIIFLCKGSLYISIICYLLGCDQYLVIQWLPLHCHHVLVVRLWSVSSYTRDPSKLPPLVTCKGVVSICLCRRSLYIINICYLLDCCQYLFMQGIPLHCHHLLVVRLWSVSSYTIDLYTLSSSVCFKAVFSILLCKGPSTYAIFCYL